MALLDEYIPELVEYPTYQKLVPFLTGMFSAGTPVGTDWKNAINVTKIFAETGKIPIKNPNEQYTAKDDVVKKGLAKVGDDKNFGRFPSHRMGLEFTNWYIEKNGLNNFLEWLNIPITKKTAEERGLKVDVIPKKYITASLLESITEFFTP